MYGFYEKASKNVLFVDKKKTMDILRLIFISIFIIFNEFFKFSDLET